MSVNLPLTTLRISDSGQNSKCDINGKGRVLFLERSPLVAPEVVMDQLYTEGICINYVKEIAAVMRDATDACTFEVFR